MLYLLRSSSHCRSTFLVAGMTDVLEEDLAVWIQANGGWVR